MARKIAKSLTLPPQLIEAAEKQAKQTDDSVSRVIGRWANLGMLAEQQSAVQG